MPMPIREPWADIMQTRITHVCCSCMMTSPIFLQFRSMVDLITKLRKESIMTLIYLIKLLKPKQNIEIK